MQNNVILTPDMMNIVQSTDLREVSGERFVLRAAVCETAGPVVAPLNHGTRFQTVNILLYARITIAFTA